MASDCVTSTVEGGRTIRWTEAVDRPLLDGKFTCRRWVIGGVPPGSLQRRTIVVVGVQTAQDAKR